MSGECCAIFFASVSKAARVSIIALFKRVPRQTSVGVPGPIILQHLGPIDDASGQETRITITTIL